MTYDEKYDAMPLRGKISVNAWSLQTYKASDWSAERSRRYKRKHHRHYDHMSDWWTDYTIGLAYKHVRNWWVSSPSKGYKRKTWKDYK